MRTYLSFPRGARIPSPRILLYSGDAPERALRDLALAQALAAEHTTGSVIVATGVASLARFPGESRVEVVKLPGLNHEAPSRPLARERIRRLRERLLSTLFDVFLPDLLLFDDAERSEPETRLLLARAQVLEVPVLQTLAHEPPGICGSANSRALAECETCRSRTLDAVRSVIVSH